MIIKTKLGSRIIEIYYVFVTIFSTPDFAFLGWKSAPRVSFKSPVQKQTPKPMRARISTRSPGMSPSSTTVYCLATLLTTGLISLRKWY